MADKENKLSISKARDHSTNVYCEKEEGDRMTVIRELYDALRQTQPYAKFIQASDMTVVEMYGIAERLRKTGWAQAHYLPIVAFCRVKPLQYVLAHRQELLGNMGQDTYAEAHYRLMRFFVSFLLGV